MNTFSKIKNSLGDALNDFGEALTAALAWLEEGDSFELAASSKRTGVRPLAQVAVRAGQKSATA